MPAQATPSQRRPTSTGRNFAVGAVVSGLLVGLLGYGTIVLFQANTPREEGVNLTGAMLATIGCLLAVALGAAFSPHEEPPASQPADA